MSSQSITPSPIQLPSLPRSHSEFIQHVVENPQKSIKEIIEPYKQYDNKLREIYAQQPHHEAASKSALVSIFNGQEKDVKIRARSLATETELEQQQYIMPLDEAGRKPNGTPAIVQSLKEFQTNFNIFSESSLADLDWSNVIVAGSAATTPLLPVPTEHAATKRALRTYYHETIAPASDVDLFLYGMTEEQAIEKVKHIERSIRDSILTETTTIRTKNAITIVSQYPTRHIQIVLRLYSSISEILLGFDVDCSCVAYDGEQVYASPRALAAYMTQTNTIDLTRRSPSYENRLSKYSHRGFEVYWPLLDRSRIDPTIFERNFQRVVGLARLLVLEKLPSSTDRDAYMDQRRAERGRPAINRWMQQRGYTLNGNIKDQHDDEIAEWVDEEAVSSYHTFTIPYGPKYNARNIEKLLYKKDLLLNAEWNQPRDREVNLHRHPTFFGSAEDIVQDCCGYCPKPITPEEEEVAAEESKRFVSGKLTFLKDDPGRQAIGSFHPLTDDDWTEMGYIGNTAVLCNAIVDHDLEVIQDWLSQEGVDPNSRDHTGRTPLHLAVSCSSLEIVQCLIEHGARIVARLADGKTALHLAAMRGDTSMVSALLRKSEANEEEEARKKSQRDRARNVAKNIEAKSGKIDVDSTDKEGSDISLLEDSDHSQDNDTDAVTDGSYVKVKQPEKSEEKEVYDDANKDDPDVYDVDVVAWDTPVSPLFLALVHGHIEVVKVLISEFGSNLRLPVKLVNQNNQSAEGAILPLVQCRTLPIEKAKLMARTLLDLGASTTQTDMNQISPLHYFATIDIEMLKVIFEADKAAAERVVNHPAIWSGSWNPQTAVPLSSAIMERNEEIVDLLLEAGAKPAVDFDTYWKSHNIQFSGQNYRNDPKHQKQNWEDNFRQPVHVAIEWEMPSVVSKLIERGADINTLSPSGHQALHQYPRESGKTVLDAVQAKLQSFKDYKEGDGNVGEPPVPLEEDSRYLNDYQPGTYAYWTVSEQLIAAKERYSSSVGSYERRVAEFRDKPGRVEKQAAIARMLRTYESLETELLERGAKSFKELHPDAKEMISHGYRPFGQNKPDKPKPWSPRLSFRNTLLDKEMAKLFQACWVGDVQTIKSYTLAAQGEGDTLVPPLSISTTDFLGYNAFQICVLRSHREAARLVLEVARLQYTPRESTGTTRYMLGNGSDDGRNDVDDIEIHSWIVDERFTIEDIGGVCLQVKSHTKPTNLVQNTCSVKPGGHNQPSSGRLINIWKNISDTSFDSEHDPLARHPPTNLVQFATRINDKDLFLFLLDMTEDQAIRKLPGDVEDAPRFFEFSSQDFNYVLECGRIDFLPEIIKRTGKGIPLDALAKKSGVEVKETPKWYQGLSVHGRKRADWAQADRGMRTQQTYNSHPPMLQAALKGHQLIVEWFQTKEATNCYFEFSKTYQDDKRLQMLAQSREGLNNSITKWLNQHSHLLMHCVILGKITPYSLSLLDHLTKTSPQLLSSKSLSGQTPLHLAFSLHRESFIRVLLEAGADQTTRDKAGNNIVHALLVSNNQNGLEDSASIAQLLSLIDTRLLSSLFTARSSDTPGSVTPLARWLYATNSQGGRSSRPTNTIAEATKTILDFSKGIELDMLSGEGDTPVHSAVRYNNPEIVKNMLAVRPDLLDRENATGRTPFEVARDAYLSQIFSEKLTLPGMHYQQFGSLLNQQPEWFVKTKAGEESRGSHHGPKKEMWSLVEELDKERAEKEGRGRKRKLVSLHEANEVAKRLATRKDLKYRGRRAARDDEDAEMKDAEEQVMDEVEQWYGPAEIIS